MKKVLLPLLLIVFSNGCISGAVYKRLVINPDKINHEFKYERGVHKKIIKGSYLGKVKKSGSDYYHLQFFNILKGIVRNVHLYLQCPKMEKKSNKYLKGYFVEGDKSNMFSDKKSLLFYHYHPNYDQKTVLSVVSKESFNQNDMKKYPTYVSGWVWDYRGTFICYPPYEWKDKIKSWNCKIDIARVERNKVMPYIRPIYGSVAFLLCIPLDVIGIIYTAGEMVISPRRIEAMFVPNLAGSIGSEEDDY
jgi:hypothetical protein